MDEGGLCPNWGIRRGRGGWERGEILSRRMRSSGLCIRKRLLAALWGRRATESRQLGNVGELRGAGPRQQQDWRQDRNSGRSQSRESTESCPGDGEDEEGV